MKSPRILFPRAFATVVFGLVTLPLAVCAQDITPPVLKNPLPDVSVAAGTTVSVVNLKKTFGLDGVTGQIVRFATSLGNMDVELDATDYPKNVANFLGYVNSGRYNGSFVHRSIAGFIFQGGGYYVAGDHAYARLETNPPTVPGEHKGSNVRGTIAMALTGGSDSADTGTDEWFFNLIDNNDPNGNDLDLYRNNQGPFTAFGRVIEAGYSVMDAIGNSTTYDLSSFATTDDPSGPSVFTEVPLINYQSSQGMEIDPDLVYINDLVVVPLVPPSVGADAVLTLKAKNNNPGLLTATITGKKLKLFYTAGQTGTATIKVFATDSAGTRVKSKFKVTVQ